VASIASNPARSSLSTDRIWAKGDLRLLHGEWPLRAPILPFRPPLQLPES